MELKTKDFNRGKIVLNLESDEPESSRSKEIKYDDGHAIILLASLDYKSILRLNLLFDPVHKVLHAGIDSGDVLARTSYSVRDHSDLVEQKVAVELLRNHQWTTGITLARVLAALQVASAKDRIVKLLLRDQFADALVFLHALALGQDRELQLLQNTGRISSLSRSAPSRDEWHESFKVLAAHWLTEWQTNGRDANWKGGGRLLLLGRDSRGNKSSSYL